ncbi:acyl-CoA synthetase [Gordonia spumicola]|uniref:Acyl-CoA synthetase n=2 Tax=Gordonia spumicola TaxID=589161 RepID=A0A7I9V4Z1_9ACTN|nr:acyl-CoA synthetase [Gordonia spumicola]
MVRLSAARWPMRVALRDDNGPLTYRALVDSADDAARALADVHRIGPGSRVGVMCRNSRDFVIALLASARLGADVVLLNTDFRGAALDAAATQQRLSLVIAAAEFADIVSATGVPVADPGMRSVHGALPSVPREGRLVLLTSGTTGNPRGVPRDPDIGALLGMVTTVLARTRLRCGMRTMIAVPMFHAFGLAVLGLTLSFSGTAVMRERFDPVATIDLCRRHEAHALMVVPAMLARILDADLPADAKTPPVVLSGGSALSPITAARFTERFGDVLYNGYGSSEVALATLATPDDLRTRPGTVGKPIEGVRIAVIGDDGRPVPTGATGRVFAGGASAVDEYVGGARKDTVAGLVSTGDLGRLDGDGRLHVIGREDDMIVSGGENVYPQALENALAAHDGIVDACAFGVADDRFGQRLTALVVSRGSLTSDDVIDHLSTRVSRYERPREIRFVDEIPRNAAGKVDRAAVRRLVGEEAR